MTSPPSPRKSVGSPPIFLLSFRQRDELAAIAERAGWTAIAARRADSAERRFIGRDALQKAIAAPARQLVGLVLEDRGVLRSHQKVVLSDGRSGEITSGTFSPTLERSIALARVPVGTPQQVQVDIRGKLLNARVVKPPFVRSGQALI